MMTVIINIYMEEKDKVISNVSFETKKGIQKYIALSL